jgi:hypothetical protein
MPIERKIEDQSKGRSKMMKSIVLGLAIVTGSSMFASAQVRVAEDRPAVVVPLPIPEVVGPRRDGPVVEERRKVETDGRGPRGGCETKSVTKEGPEGSKTVTKERCD